MTSSFSAFCNSLTCTSTPPTAVFESVHALAEMDLLREPLSAAAHTPCEHVRSLESSGVFNCSEAGPVCVEHDASQPCVGKEFFTTADGQRLLPEKVNNSRCFEETQNQKDAASDWPCAEPIFTPESVQRARNDLLYRAVDIERHPGPERAYSSRGRDVVVQDVMPTTAQRYDGAVPDFEKLLGVRDILVLEELLDHGLNELGPFSIFEPALHQVPSDRQAGTLTSGLRRYVLPARSCDADLEDHQTVFDSNLELRSRSAFRQFPSTAPQPWRVTSTSHAPRAQRR